MNGYNNWNCVTDPNPVLERFGVSERATFTELARLDNFLKKDCSLWSFGCNNDYQRALDNCSPLTSILLGGAEAFSNGLFEVLNYSTQNYVRGAYREWDKLLSNPNPFASKMQFLQSLYINRRTYGYCYALPIYPTGFKDRPTAIYILPGEFIRVEPRYKNKPFYEYAKGESIRRIYFSAGGYEKEIDENDLILFKDNTRAVNPYTLLPESLLCSLHYPISLFDSSQRAAISLVEARGPLGFISNSQSTDPLGKVPFTNEEKVELQRDLSRYGLDPTLWKYVISGQNLSWVPIQVNIAELRLDENKINAMKEWCWSFGYPFVLSPFSDQSTYNNVVEAKKQLYQDTIIPQAQSIIEQLNAGLQTHENNIDIKVTYEDLYIFQQSIKEKGDGLRSLNLALQIEWNAGNITRNMWLKTVGRDEISREEFNKYKWELTPEELGIVQQNVNDGQQSQTAAA